VHDDRSLVEGRVRRALTHKIRPAVHVLRVPLQLQAWPVPGEPVPVGEALAAPYEPFGVGTRWGAPWSTTWVRATGRVPADWAGRRVEARFDLGFIGDWPGNQAEALVHTADGTPIKGVAPDNQTVPLYRPASGGEEVSLLLEMAANPDILADNFRPTLLGDVLTAPKTPLYTMAAADLVVLDEEVWQLAVDLEVLEDVMLQQSVHEPRRYELARAIDRALDALDLDDVSGTAAAARAELADVLAAPAAASAHTLWSVGHAHIDSAWLWPLRETVRKTSRTFANVTHLATEYPEFVFACSQAQQYAWVKERFPQIFTRMQAAAKAGQWVPVGGMWVEADGNLPGGEALVRQFVTGKRFIEDEFGVECRGVWLPDSFGYSGAYPQIARLAGMDWFLTQKISWNQTNPFPHHTFRWEGIDGTQIFTHFPPIDTYNAVFSGEELTRAVTNYREKGRGTMSLVPFGHGDGGGGPTREMLERARRLNDLDGAPKVIVRDPNEFFEAARAEYPEPPVWSGELYLEVHRATYTSQARTKAGNRRSEHLLREAELWAATAAVLAPRAYAYPYEELDRIWKVVLLQQFHDILPGSSIAWVHREAEQTYRRIAAELEELVATALAALGAPGGAGPAGLVANAAPHARAEVLELASTEGTQAGAAERARAQRLANGGVARFVRVPGSGLTALDLDLDPEESLPASGPVEVSTRQADLVLANGLLTVTVDADGLLPSVIDERNGREAVAPGQRANLLQLHQDFPNYWDAWDVDQHYRNRVLDLTGADEVTVVDAGPLVARVRVVRSFKSSRVTQHYELRAGSDRLDVRTEIDWHEAEKFLKASFPLDVHADRCASEIQFGHIFRPTHVNTSWEAARFETVMHRWVHVAEPGYGIAIANDSTYGHDTTRNARPDGGTTTTVRLSLVRAPRVPDPGADQGRHTMTYALVPGAQIADAVRAGYDLNLPLRAATGPTGPGGADGPDGSAGPDGPDGRIGAARPEPLIAVSGDGATLEAVKLAEDRSGDVVVRLYEAWGARARARITAGFEVASATVTDLLERPLADAPAPVPVPVSEGAGGFEVDLRPFQILTVRLARR
jgi:alpha-mannosidase